VGAPRATGEPGPRRGLAITLGVVLVLSLLLILAIVGPAGFVVGIALALLPLPIYVLLALWIDRYEPEPRRLLAWAFIWGAGAATLIALIVNSVGIELVGAEFGSDVGEIYGGSVSAPVVEEGSKALALYGVYRWRRSELDGVLDGIVYAAMVGLGFATTENVLYYGTEAIEHDVGVGTIFVMRGVASPFAHPIFTAMTGIGLALAATATKRSRRFWAPVLGLLGAMLLHSAWNTSSIDGGAFVLTFVFVMFPAFVALIVVALVARRRDGRRVAAYLGPEVGRGLLSHEDVQALSTMSGRARARRAARASGGKPAAKARGELHRAATDLAFLRHRLALGRQDPDAPAPAQQEAEYVARIAQLTGRLPAPPPQAAAPPPPPGPPPNWYPDPSGRFRLRYWDGYSWTGHTSA
jgi:RsiW-degrading membrane proteinase PrsW (M82 family)